MSMASLREGLYLPFSRFPMVSPPDSHLLGQLLLAQLVPGPVLPKLCGQAHRFPPGLLPLQPAVVQAEEDDGQAKAQSQRLGHGAAVRGQEMEEQQQGAQQGTFRHKGGGGRLAECEEE